MYQVLHATVTHTIKYKHFELCMFSPLPVAFLLAFVCHNGSFGWMQYPSSSTSGCCSIVACVWIFIFAEVGVVCGGVSEFCCASSFSSLLAKNINEINNFWKNQNFETNNLHNSTARISGGICSTNRFIVNWIFFLFRLFRFGLTSATTQNSWNFCLNKGREKNGNIWISFLRSTICNLFSKFWIHLLYKFIEITNFN